MKLTKKKLEIIIFAAVTLAVALLPVVANTGTYPLAIIDGNSMYPHFENGDLVYYYAPKDKANLPNGTVIVFVQGNAGSSLFDGLVRPVVIHRIIGQTVGDDGVVYYTTRGDNNDVNDPFQTKSDNILGVEGQAIPKIGLIPLFLKSPQGLIATIGVITLSYLSIYDVKRRRDKNKEKLIGALAKKTLNGYLSEEQFKKLELAIKYSDEMEDTGLKDKNINALVEWLKNGGLDEKWKMKMVTCPRCFNIAVGIEASKDNSVTICPKCNAVKTWHTTLEIDNKYLNDTLLASIDEAFSCFGDQAKALLYRHLEKNFGIKKKELPQKLDAFTAAMQKIFGPNAAKMDLLLIHTFKKNLLFGCKVDPNSYPFQEFVQQVKENLNHKDDINAPHSEADQICSAPALGCNLQRKQTRKRRPKSAKNPADKPQTPEA
jgi:signal peptidase